MQIMLQPLGNLFLNIRSPTEFVDNCISIFKPRFKFYLIVTWEIDSNTEICFKNINLMVGISRQVLIPPVENCSSEAGTVLRTQQSVLKFLQYVVIETNEIWKLSTLAVEISIGKSNTNSRYCKMQIIS